MSAVDRIIDGVMGDSTNEEKDGDDESEEPKPKLFRPDFYRSRGFTPDADHEVNNNQ